MTLVYCCDDCGNVSRFDNSGDGKCNECGSLMSKATESALCDEDKKTLFDSDETEGTETTKVVNLDTNNRDLLSK